MHLIRCLIFGLFFDRGLFRVRNATKIKYIEDEAQTINDAGGIMIRHSTRNITKCTNVSLHHNKPNIPKINMIRQISIKEKPSLFINVRNRRTFMNTSKLIPHKDIEGFKVFVVLKSGENKVNNSDVSLNVVGQVIGWIKNKSISEHIVDVLNVVDDLKDNFTVVNNNVTNNWTETLRDKYNINLTNPIFVKLQTPLDNSTRLNNTSVQSNKTENLNKTVVKNKTVGMSEKPNRRKIDNNYVKDIKTPIVFDEFVHSEDKYSKENDSESRQLSPQNYTTTNRQRSQFATEDYQKTPKNKTTKQEKSKSPKKYAPYEFRNSYNNNTNQKYYSARFMGNNVLYSYGSHPNMP